MYNYIIISGKGMIVEHIIITDIHSLELILVQWSIKAAHHHFLCLIPNDLINSPSVVVIHNYCHIQGHATYLRVNMYSDLG